MAKKRSKAARDVAGVEVARKRLDELVPADYNPRRISDEALAGLGRSVEEFGYVEPIVWNKRTNRVVSGHQRMKVLARKGVEEVDVVVVDLDEARERALNVTMNNQTIQGEWDEAKLLSLLDDLKGLDLDEGLHGGLRLDALLESLGGGPPPEPPASFPPVDPDGGADHKCPKCGYEWDGKPK